MSDKWVVVNIGCIECGVSSALVGVFTTEGRANAEAERCNGAFGWREGGQNEFLVFRLGPDDEVATEYADAGGRTP